MKLSKSKVTLSVLVVIVVLGTGVYLWKRGTLKSAPAGENFNWSCIERTQNFSRDVQLQGLIPNGGTYTLLKNYYACNPMRRGEIVAVRIEGVEHPIPRIVRGVPGDVIEVLPFPQNQGFVLRIQGEMLMNATKKRPQLFAEGKWGKEKAPEIAKIFHEPLFTLKEDEFLVFSYADSASADSSEFGPVSSGQILGRGLAEP